MAGRYRRFAARPLLTVPFLAWVAVPIGAWLASHLSVPPEEPGRPRATAVEGWLGWRVAEAGGEGLRVLEVSPAGPAARAGVRAGDVILSVDGVPARGIEGVRALAKARAGESLAVERARGGADREKLVLVVASAQDPEAVLARTAVAGTRALVALQRPDGLWSDELAASAFACAALASASAADARAAHARGKEALLARRGPDGLVGSALASAALLLALDEGAPRDELRDALARAQEPSGAWQDLATSAWVVEALARARLPRERPEWTRAVERAGRAEERERAEALRIVSLAKPVAPDATLAAELGRESEPSTVASLARALRATRASGWAESVVRLLARTQEPATGRWSGRDGPVVGTALSLLALETAREELSRRPTGD